MRETKDSEEEEAASTVDVAEEVSGWWLEGERRKREEGGFLDFEGEADFGLVPRQRAAAPSLQLEL